MIILDTNIISELLRPNPDLRVLDWFDNAPDLPIALTAITVAELRFGVAMLRNGGRRHVLEQTVSNMLNVEFADAILPFDQAAAEVYAEIAARNLASGYNVGQSDIMIAAIALVNDAILLTRNTRDFVGQSLEIHDPFGGY